MQGGVWIAEGGTFGANYQNPRARGVSDSTWTIAYYFNVKRHLISRGTLRQLRFQMSNAGHELLILAAAALVAGNLINMRAAQSGVPV